MENKYVSAETFVETMSKSLTTLATANIKISVLVAVALIKAKDKYGFNIEEIEVDKLCELVVSNMSLETPIQADKTIEQFFIDRTIKRMED